MQKRPAIYAILLILTLNTLAILSCSSPVPTPVTKQPAASNTNITPQQVQLEGQVQLPSLSQVVNEVKVSVVSINVESVTLDFFNRPATVQGAGSGWIIDRQGHVVTNNHVVEGADSVKVTTSDGITYNGTDIKTDPVTDLAIITINANNLTPLNIASFNLSVGDFALAIGNALGLGSSATLGIISALDVTLEASPGQTLQGFIQTDAAINPGNSGGPLVNLSGEVIGITSQKISQVGVEGMGYAISIDEALPVIQALIETGCVIRPWPGISYTTVDSIISSIYQLPMQSGVVITSLDADGPAVQAGLQPGDIITAVEGQVINNADDFTKLINSLSIGQVITLTYWRSDTEHHTTLTLAESPC